MNSLLYTLCGCAKNRFIPPHSWNIQKKQLQSITHWSVQGAISIQYQNTSTINHFYWQQWSKRYRLRISDPLGIRHIIITGQPGIAKLWETPTKAMIADSAEALLIKKTHWHLPVKHLRYWIRGLPAPHVEQTTQFNKQHLIAKLKQEGWYISYAQYQFVQRLYLPKIIYLQYPHHHLKIKIVVHQWHIFHT